jgi:hypothetical protein
MFQSLSLFTAQYFIFQICSKFDENLDYSAGVLLKTIIQTLIKMKFALSKEDELYFFLAHSYVPLIWNSLFNFVNVPRQ